MKKAVWIAFLLLLIPFAAANARPRQVFDTGGAVRCDDRYPATCDVRGWRWEDPGPAKRRRAGDNRPADCPRLWCGCWLAKQFGLSDRSLWLARSWAKKFPRVQQPRAGDVAVYARGRGGHVVKILDVPRPGVIVGISGNDGGAVRVRERSTRGLIAFVRVEHRG